MNMFYETDSCLAVSELFRIHVVFGAVVVDTI